MQLRRSFFPLVLTALLGVAPLAAAWSAMGSHEPDTTYDSAQGWMFGEPDVKPCTTAGCDVNQVYFNAFRSTNLAGYGLGLAGGAQGNPNSGTLGTSVGPAQYENYAVLGVWKDCNADGFVGLGDQGLWEYRAEVLSAQDAAHVGPGTSICPPTPVPNPIPAGWVPPHNDGQWVHEFLAIGWDAYSGDQNPWKLTDNEARVWYDNGVPNGQPALVSCWLNPPVGAMHSTGGVLWWGDCLDGYRVTDNFDNVADSNAQTRTLSFSDAPHQQYASASLLNVYNPWGNPSDGADAQAWDCSRAQLAQESVSDPSGRGLVNPVYVNVSAPMVPPGTSPPTDPLHRGAGLAGTTNATASGVDRCQRRTDGGGRASALAQDPYAAEAPVAQTPAHAASNGVMAGIDTAHRASTCALAMLAQPATYFLLGSDGCTVSPLGATPPISTDLGSNPTGPGTPTGYGQKFTTLDGVWWDSVTITNKATGVTRTQTSYAYVSPAAVSAYHLALPNGGNMGTYGAEWCGGSTTGVHSGWDCDVSHWWRDSNGLDISPASPYLGKDPARTGACTPDDSVGGAIATGTASRGCYHIAPYPGAPFDLRDVDCDDNSVPAVRGAVGPVDLPAGLGTLDGCGSV